MFLLFCKSKWLKVLNENALIFTKEPQDNVESLNLNDINLFLNQLKNDTNKPEILKIRDYAIGLILIYWWLRVQELCNLKIDDLWKKIKIIEKWNIRVIPFKEEYLKIIEFYLSLRKDLWINSEYVFISHSNNSLWNKLSRASVEEVIRKAWENAWIGKVRPHKLRHTYAVLMLENGKDRKSISQTLWYKNKQAAQRYFNHKISNQIKQLKN
jgi:integrase/recombinase XerD